MWDRSGTEAGSAGTSPKQEKWSLHQEWSSTVQYKQHIPPVVEYASPICHSLPYQGTAGT